MSALIATAIEARLAGDAELAGLIGAYLGAPAIFKRFPVPADADLPYVLIGAPVTDESEEAMGESLSVRDQERDVTVWFPNDGATAKLDQAAERIRSLLHRHKLELAGATTVRAKASGPIDLGTDDDACGRVISVKLRFHAS